MRKTILFTVLLALALVPVSHVATHAAAKGPVVVASKIDTEGALLGKMIVLLLEENGFKAVDRTEFGPTPMVRKAITSGQIDIYPEYTGNAGFFFGISDQPIWKDARQGYMKAKELDKKNNDIVWLTPAPANNTWAICVRGDLAKKEKISTLEDFAGFINRGGRVKLAGSEEFVTSAAALPAFQKAYGFSLRKDQLLTLSGGNTAQTEKAAAQGINGVNFAMAYGTDGQLAALGLVVLEDTKGIQPVYEPTPIIRATVLSKYPEIEGILDPVFKSLDLVTLQTLNASIAVQGLDAKDVAAKYLKSKGFIK